MKLIFVLNVVFLAILFINLLEIVEIIRAFRVNAFMDDEMLTVFFRSERMGTVRAS
jgi:hypothetical protein